MTTKILAIWMGACAIGMARPGSLDRNFDPELRAWVAPDFVTVAADGRAWIGGGFDRGDGYSTGDLVRMGENGGVRSEPAVGYLNREIYDVLPGGAPRSLEFPRSMNPFLLEGGEFLLAGESGGWLRMSAAGTALGKAFQDRQAGEMVTPQFERAGKLWVIRRLVNGERVLEKRRSVDGVLDDSFSQAVAVARKVTTAVPGPDGGAWLLVSDLTPYFIFGWNSDPFPKQEIFQVNAAGTLIGQPRLITESRTVDLVRGPNSSFRLIYGPDQRSWGFWPRAESKSHRIEWYSAAGGLERSKEFLLPLYARFAWAESSDGSFVAMDGRTKIAGSSQFSVGNGSLRRYRPDGVEDLAFLSPGGVRSVKAMAGGKWLVDGLRRLHADGREDAAWKVPDLSRLATVQKLLPLPGGRVLVGGNFAKVDNLVKNRLVVFRASGALDPTFVPDERILEWRSIAVFGSSIYVVTSGRVRYRDGFEVNLLKLRLDGSLDESFKPAIAGWPPFFSNSVPIFYPMKMVGSVTCMPNGDLLVETSQSAGDIDMSELVRLRPDGSRVPGFQLATDFRYNRNPLALRNGGFISSGVLYRADGSLDQVINQSNLYLDPVCECAGGILFKVGDGFVPSRLALWTRNGFARGFRPPALDWSKPVTASSGELGTIYLAATLVNGWPAIHRLWPNGQIDRTFRGPVLENRERQRGRYWWKAEEAGRVAFDCAAAVNQLPLAPQSLLIHPSTRSLWIGGDFITVNGQPRDGLARISGDFSWWPWR